MASSIQQAKVAGMAILFPQSVRADLANYQACYEANRHHVYSVSFWMTDSELSADEMTRNVFLRVFASGQTATAERVDRALIAELREQGALGVLTLEGANATEVLNVRSNVLRIHLERAVMQLPRTERLAFLLHDVEGYGHKRISQLVGFSEAESRAAVHQARLRMRELISHMN